MSQSPDPIGEMQDAIVARLEAAFGLTSGPRMLKEVEPIEIPFDAETSKKARISPPAAYVLPLKVMGGGVTGLLVVDWAVYAVAGRATSRTRAKGGAGPLGLGAYAIASTAALALQHWAPPVDCTGTLELIGIENLTGWAMVDDKLHVWAVMLRGEMPCQALNPTDENGQPIGDFLTFWADVDIAPVEPAPETLPDERDAVVKVELPGP